MTEKEIKKNIINAISQGALKFELYQKYETEIDDENLRAILAFRPSYENWKRFKKMHLILSLIWGFYLFFELFNIFELAVFFSLKIIVSLMLSAYITINIWKFDGRFFLPGIIWLSFTILRSFTITFNDYQYDPDFKIILLFAAIYSLVLAVGIFIMYYLRKNIFSYMKWFKPILNTEGKIKFE